MTAVEPDPTLGSLQAQVSAELLARWHELFQAFAAAVMLRALDPVSMSPDTITHGAMIAHRLLAEQIVGAVQYNEELDDEFCRPMLRLYNDLLRFIEAHGYTREDDRWIRWPEPEPAAA